MGVKKKNIHYQNKPWNKANNRFSNSNIFRNGSDNNFYRQNNRQRRPNYFKPRNYHQDSRKPKEVLLSDLLTFKAKFENMKGPSVTLQISKPETVDEIDVLNWVKQLRILIKINDWKKTETFKVLSIVLAPELQYIYKGKRTVDTAIDSIVGHWFPKHKFSFYINQLNEIGSKEFTGVIEYKNELLGIVEKDNLCLRKKTVSLIVKL